MLASIHPLGERARGQRFVITAVAYVTGSVLGGALVAGVLGELGHLVFGSRAGVWRALMLMVAAAVAVVVDAGSHRVPSLRRQVNEDWLTQYRGWIYGFGFGFQLGLGVVTIVTTAAVYLVGVAAFTVASPLTGLVVGASFGVVRALPLLVGARLRSTAAVVARVTNLQKRASTFRVVTVLGEATVACLALVAAVR